MTEPKCPSCGAVGISKIVSKPSLEEHDDGTPWFHVIHCSQCGHVYGVIPKRMSTVAITPGPRTRATNRQ